MGKTNRLQSEKNQSSKEKKKRRSLVGFGGLVTST